MKNTGELLKKAREDKRLSLHEVALFLKINSRVLQAIEDGDASHLPARTFLRGFIQSYAKFLKLDPAAVLQVFTDESAPLAPTPLIIVPTAEVVVREEKAAKATSPKVEQNYSEAKQAAQEKADIDVISLEKSILTQSQVAQDKLGIKTIAVSVVGLLLVGVLYTANNVVKKYQKEAQVDPVDTPKVPIAQETMTEAPVEEVGAPVTSATVALPQATGQVPAAEVAPTAAPAVVAAPTPAPVAAPPVAEPIVAEPAPVEFAEKPVVAPKEPTAKLAAVQVPESPLLTSAPNLPNSVEPHTNTFNSFFMASLVVPKTKIDAKPKLPEASDVKPVEKPVTPPAATTVATPVAATPPVTVAVAPAPPPPTAPVGKPIVVTATPTPPVAAAAAPTSTTPQPPAATPPPTTPEGKLVEVIVEANDAVEIEYSSSKTNPQKMLLRAEQVHTFKSRSGVRLKISNGGAVNIIMNGRDLGVPGAAGQPVQVTY